MTRLASSLLFAVLTLSGAAQASTFEERPAQLVGDFVAALDQVATGRAARVNAPGVQLWVDGLAAHGVDPQMLAKRLGKARLRARNPFARYETVTVEHLPDARPVDRAGSEPFALHATKMSVLEDYDDTTNDDIYCYFITTHDDQVWGKATSIYRGMDEGDSFFFLAEDRGLFGPKGDKLVPENHTIVDFGIVESDGEDITQLKKISDAIVDLAMVALEIYNPEAGAAAAQARAEVQNLLHLVIEMDDDDHLVTDSLYFTPDSMRSMLSNETFSEIDRTYDSETALTHFAYTIRFRLLR